jgi:general secretion pathway protein G
MEETMIHSKSNHSKAFSLVEILLVVTILGILAALVIPRFSNATEVARVGAVKSVLRTVRSQLEQYRLHHNDYPTLAQMWDSMLNKTFVDGTVDVNGAFGPYLLQEPSNPFTLSTTIVAPGAGTANDGWEYDDLTGDFFAVGFDEVSDTFTSP